MEKQLSVFLQQHGIESLSEKPRPPVTQSDELVIDIVEHHGVKGQRWGIRNKKSSMRTSGDAARVANLRKKRPHQLTNKQIKLVNERMNLEQNFRRLNPGKFVTGKHLVEGILATATIGVTAFNLLHSPAGKAAVEAGKRMVKAKI